MMLFLSECFYSKAAQGSKQEQGKMKNIEYLSLSVNIQDTEDPKAIWELFT